MPGFKIFVIVVVFLIAAGVQAQTEAEPAEPAQPAEPIVVSMVICSGISERLPVDTVSSFPEGTLKVYAWCHVTGANDSTSVWVDWFYNEELKAEVELPVKSSDWRTWSSKNLLPSWTGSWEVRVRDSENNILESVNFTIGATASETEKP